MGKGRVLPFARLHPRFWGGGAGALLFHFMRSKILAKISGKFRHIPYPPPPQKKKPSKKRKYRVLPFARLHPRFGLGENWGSLSHIIRSVKDFWGLTLRA